MPFLVFSPSAPSYIFRTISKRFDGLEAPKLKEIAFLKRSLHRSASKTIQNESDERDNRKTSLLMQLMYTF